MSATRAASRRAPGRSSPRAGQGQRVREAKELGIGPRQYDYARDQGLLVRRKDGTLDVEATRSLIASETSITTEAETDYAAELRRVRLIQAKLTAEITAMERDERKGILVRRDAVRSVVDAAMITLRERLSVIPARVAGGDEDLRQRLDDEIREALRSAIEAIQRLGAA